MDYSVSYTVVILVDPVPYNPIEPKVMKAVQSFWDLGDAKKVQNEMKEKTIIIATY